MPLAKQCQGEAHVHEPGARRQRPAGQGTGASRRRLRYQMPTTTVAARAHHSNGAARRASRDDEHAMRCGAVEAQAGAASARDGISVMVVRNGDTVLMPTVAAGLRSKGRAS